MSDHQTDGAPTSTEETRTRPEVVAPLREAVSFLGTLPHWQQHIAHSLVTEGRVTEETKNVAYRLLLIAHGLLDEDPPVGQRVVDVPTVNADAEAVVLQSVCAADVNKIARGQVLPFNTHGLTVVYGENASGKSGYARLLKALCGGPGARSRLLPDVLTQTDVVVPGAEVRYRIASEEVRRDWRATEGTIGALAGIRVFDSDAAPMLADSERVLEFLPAGLHILGPLAKAMTELGARIDAEAAASRRSLPPVTVEPDDTHAARLVMRLAEGRALPTPEQLIAAARWAETDELALGSASTKLGLDPAKSAERARRLAGSLENMAARVGSLDELLGNGALAELEKLRVWAAEARALAAATAENVSNRVSVLAGVGSDVWRQMFVSARDYAMTAFGSSALPPEVSDPRCPLCQQPLADDAANRLRQFTEYIEGEAERIAAEAEQSVANRLEAIAAVTVQTREDVHTVAALVEPLLPSALPDIELAAAAFDAAGERRQAVLDGKGEAVWASLPWPAAVPNVLTSHAGALRAIAEEHGKLMEGPAREALQQERDELLARRSLAEQSAAASQRLGLLQRLGALALARQACDTTTVSRKNSELRRAFVTADYESRLRQEFAFLGLEHLPLRLTARTESGHSLASVTLESQWQLRNREVLSDGEMRALALACFFAEAQRTPGSPPIVLDDPVSSLDHERVERVARRIVAESRDGRQVIVFTHSLVFVHELWMRASEARVPTTTHWVRTVRGVPGNIQAKQRPWEVADVKPRLGELEKRLAATRRIDDHSTDGYRSAVAHFYTGLRETWERLVEELLLGRVVERYRLSVETLRLSAAEVTEDDYATVYFAMDRTSQFTGHDRPVARQLAAPTPDEMSRDLEEIREYAKRLRARNQRLEKQRHGRREAPQGRLELGA